VGNLPTLPRDNHLRAVFTVALGMLAASSGGVAAQTLSGRLLNVNNEEPLESGVVSLLDASGVEVVQVVTDGNGRFVLKAPRPGTYLVKARRLGFRQWIDGPVELHSGDDLHGAFHLRPEAITLSELNVTADASVRFLRSIGFYDRAKSDFGHFITRDQIDTRRPQQMSDLLRGIPGVTVIPAAAGAGQMHVNLRGSRLSEGGPCDPRIFIDGLIASRGGSGPKTVNGMTPEGILDDPSATDPRDPGPTINDLVTPREIEAVEVYRSASQIPAQFGGAGADTRCGVIVVWTRRGR
jgi:Carboxypeptidase regulatory-like domain/TonB-dependent Receptor Plug Domain